MTEDSSLTGASFNPVACSTFWVAPGQTCCGQMHINTGYQREALPLGFACLDPGREHRHRLVRRDRASVGTC